MSKAVLYNFHRGIALLQLHAPPMNSLSHNVRGDLLRCLERASQERAHAIVLTGFGKSFSTGADISEFAKGKHTSSPTLHEVICALDDVSVPTVAGLHGYCLGGGLELALACHWRFADSSALMGLPEVHLGLLPGAGGTQRLPRLIGVEHALEMMSNGTHVSAPDALKNGLIDGVIDGVSFQHMNLEGRGSEAVKVLCDIASSERVRGVPVRDRVLSYWKVPQSGVQDSFAASRRGSVVPPQHTDLDAFFTAYHRQHFAPAETPGFSQDESSSKFRGVAAPGAIFKCVQVAAKSSSFSMGLQYERRAFEQLASGTQAQALQYLFFAERKNRVLSAALRSIVTVVPTSSIDKEKFAVLSSEWVDVLIKTAQGQGLAEDPSSPTEVIQIACTVAKAMLDALLAEMQHLASLELGSVSISKQREVMREHFGGWDPAGALSSTASEQTETGATLSGVNLISRLMFPAINAGYHALGSAISAASGPHQLNGLIAVPEQVDLLFVSACIGDSVHRFPRHKGGPFFWAERDVKLAPLALRLKELHAASPSQVQYKPCDLLMDVVQSRSTLKEDLYFRAQK